MPERQPEMRTKKSERTLLIALLLSAPGPAIISYAAFASGSAAQMADFLRRTSELVATFVSWLMYHKLRKLPFENAGYSARLERLTNYTVAAAMSASGIALIIVGIVRLLSAEQSGKTPLGLIIASLGLAVNISFWLKYRAMNHRQPDPVIAAQQRLYRGKSSVDVCIVTALAAVTIAPSLPLTLYIDAFGSIAVAVYLLYNGVDVIRQIHR
ncbi:MAG: cation transporter [Oscillospiraceae bacterium]